ncbi:hypothetical protein [Streptomyces sp. NPDC004050]
MFPVCGDAGRTAKDVDQALGDFAATHGAMDDEEAAASIRRLFAEGATYESSTETS